LKIWRLPKKPVRIPDMPLDFDPNESVRDIERQNSKAHNIAIKYPVGVEAQRAHLQTRSADPFPEVPPALLNSADIADYVSATGMLDPFHPSKLKTASYEVALLGRYIFVNTEGETEEGFLSLGDTFELPPNSIAFMTAEPYFRLPDYIAMRHNLKIKHVYKGLLVGTGPLIDPGFVGKLSLPIHNLTENTYTLTGGEGIVWVEFTKLSPHESWDPRVRRRARQGSYTSFPTRKSREAIVDDYVRDAVGVLGTPWSSSAQIAAQSKRAETIAIKTRKKLEKFAATISFAGIAAVIGLFIAVILPLQVSITERYDALQEELQTVRDLLSNSSVGEQDVPTPTPTPTSTR